MIGEWIAKFVNNHDKSVHRALEILPGAFSWTLILFPLWGSFWVPHYVAYFVILFDIFWFYKSGTLAVTVVLSHIKIRAAERYSWMNDLKKLPDWKKIHHVVIIPTYKEPELTLIRGIDSIAQQDLGPKQITVVLAMEDREAGALQKGNALKKKYDGVFGNFFITIHPDIEGEVKGKSSNEAWAGRWVKKELIDRQKMDIEYMTVTSKDADSIMHKKYYSCLSYKFLTNPDRHFRFWQAAIMFYSNIWRIPAPIRVVNTFCTLWQTAQLMRKDRIINYSTYSLSMKMLHEVDYWDVDVIPEDYRLFFKSYFKLDGKVEVEPVYLSVHADAAEANGYVNTMINQYEQMKRWAWGASDDAYIIKNWMTNHQIPFWTRTMRVVKVLEDHFLWPVNWFVITLGANIPLVLNPEFSQTVLGTNLPKITFGLMTLAWVFLIVMIIVDLRQRPKSDVPLSPIKRMLMPFEFILMPVTGLFFSALPGLDAHTRLMLGKYIEYRVTEKV